jgi:hypothetical protein
MPDPLISPPKDAAAASSILMVALGQIEFARAYVLELLDATPQELWQTIPSGAASNIAWQVGHLAVSQYGLLMFRQRGRAPEDLELVPGKFRKMFGRGSTPTVETAPTYSNELLLERLHTIHTQALSELRNADPRQLLESVDMPYAVYPIKLGAVLFAPLHEQLHAGQIGALRRQLGLEPIR